MLVLTSHRRPLAPLQLLSIEKRSIAADWTRTPLTTPIQWCVAKDPRHLWFHCELPWAPACNESLPLGTFFVGLWTDDVAELFVRDAQTGRYQEFNFSPTGAWWSCVFSSYRTRDRILAPHPAPAIRTLHGEESWSVSAGIPLESLSISLDRNMELHVSAICTRPAERFFSSRPVSHVAPDFHHQECFEQIEFGSVIDSE